MKHPCETKKKEWECTEDVHIVLCNNNYIFQKVSRYFIDATKRINYCLKQSFTRIIILLNKI